MAFLGIEFNDAGITGVQDGRILFAEPGCAFVSGGEAIFGAEALSAARKNPRAYYDRYWRDLSEHPVTTGAASLGSYADLAHAQLQKLWEQVIAANRDTNVVAFAVPSYWNRDQLALLLGISEELGMPVGGMAEMPVAASRRPYPGCDLIHIDVYAHSSVLSRVDQSDSPTVTAQELIESMGIVVLQRSCAEYFARCFLECSRFDPMHAAASEQRVYDQLDEWIALLVRSAEAELSFDYEGNQFTARAVAAQLAESLQRRCQPLLQALRSMLDAGARTVLQIDSRVAMLPGVADALRELSGCVVVVENDGAAARGLESRQAHFAQADGAAGVVMSTTLPWDQAPTEIQVDKSAGLAAQAVPSHLLLDGIAYRLGDKPLRIGAEVTAGEYSLVVAASHGGVSRRHCSLEFDAEQVILSDYSRYGTRLNGHRVNGSVVLQAGDVISIGDPPCELKLITETGPDGT